jgi:hypothetical protein
VFSLVIVRSTGSHTDNLRSPPIAEAAVCGRGGFSPELLVFLGRRCQPESTCNSC